MRRFRQFFGLLAVVIGLCLPSALAVYAQDEGEAEIVPFLQSDLKVLTGDVQRPNGIYWHDGFLYTGCAGDWTLYRLDALTGITATYIFGVRDVHSLYVEDGPTIWALDYELNQLVSINHETGLVPIRQGLAQPWGLAPSLTDDSFFITEWGSDNLINMTRQGSITVVASEFDDPSGIVATADSLYVANNASARRAVEWLDISSGSDPTPQPLVSGLQNATNLVLGPDDMLYIAYALGTRGVVGRVDPEVCKAAGGCTNVDVELVIWTDLAAPLAGLTIAPDMRLYVHTIYGTEIYWVDLNQEG